MLPVRPTTAALALICFGLAAANAALLLTEVRLPEVETVESTAVAGALRRGLASAGGPAVTLPHRHVRLERSLFGGPPAETAKRQKTADRRPARGIVLKGIIVEGGQRIAFLRRGASVKLLRAREGERAGPWIVEKIEAKTVVLRNGSVRKKLKLRPDT